MTAVLLAASPSLCGEREMLILATTVNQMPYGDRYFLCAAEDCFAGAKDLAAFGIELKGLEPEIIEEEGDRWVSLRSLAPAVTFKLSLEELSIAVTVDPYRLPIFHLHGPRPPETASGTSPDPWGWSAFLNYGASLQCLGRELDCMFLGTAESGVTVAQHLLVNSALYRYPDSGFVREMTYLVRDFQENHARGAIGDMLVMSPPLGSGGLITGLGYWTEYSIDPYFPRYPVISFMGAVGTPAQVEVYSNGALIKRRQIPAGRFAMGDLHPAMGQNDVQVVVRDAMGNREVFSQSYFLAPTGLRPGVHEQRFYVGAQRQNYGIESFAYGMPAYYAQYRRGLLDWYTAGLSMEGGVDVFQAALESAFVVSDLFSFSIDAAASSTSEALSGAMALRFFSSHAPLTLGGEVSYYFHDYATVSMPFFLEERQLAYSIWTGLSFRKVGAFRVIASGNHFYSGDDDAVVALGYNRNLPWSLSLFVTGSVSGSSMAGAGPVDASLMVLLTRPFGGGYSSSAAVEAHRDGLISERIHVQKTPPFGDGWGGWVNLTHGMRPGDRRFAVDNTPVYNVDGIYNFRYGTVWADLIGDAAGLTGLSASFNGGIAALDNSVHFTRPISDSFGLVKVDHLEGIRVYDSNREVGKTDADGELLLPDLLAYQYNKLSVDVHDLPLDYRVRDVELFVTPWHRSGVVCDFRAVRLQAVSGTVAATVDGKKVALGPGTIFLQVGEESRTGPTGFAGEFYLEEVPAGSWAGEVVKDGTRYACTLDVPQSGEAILDMGEVHCEPAEAR